MQAGIEAMQSLIARSSWLAVCLTCRNPATTDTLTGAFRLFLSAESSLWVES
jgi:hypothetical protein